MKTYDDLHEWISAKGKARQAEVDEACLYFERRVRGMALTEQELHERLWVLRNAYLRPLLVLGHVEWEGRREYHVTPPTLAIHASRGEVQEGRLYGARPPGLWRALETAAGSGVLRCDDGGHGPAVWTMADRSASLADLATRLGIAIVPERGRELLEALSPLGTALSTAIAAPIPSGGGALERYVPMAPGDRGNPWKPADRYAPQCSGYYRFKGAAGLRWFYVFARDDAPPDRADRRGAVDTPGARRGPGGAGAQESLAGDRAVDLRTKDQRSAAEWREVRKKFRIKFLYDANACRLAMPATPKPPILVERGLCLAGGRAARPTAGGLAVYCDVDRRRAMAVARVLNVELVETELP